MHTLTTQASWKPIQRHGDRDMELELKYLNTVDCSRCSFFALKPIVGIPINQTVSVSGFVFFFGSFELPGQR